MTIRLAQTKKWLKSNRLILKSLIFNLILMVFTGWLLLHHTQLHLCLTPSLEGIRFLVFQKVTPIKRGDIVAIQGHDYKHLGVQPYAKRVIGFTGDPIIREESLIKIGSRTLPLIEKTKEGHPLTPITHRIVPTGYLFVAGDHPRSIDSRYEEFGLVPVEKVWGKAIWQW